MFALLLPLLRSFSLYHYFCRTTKIIYTAAPLPLSDATNLICKPIESQYIPKPILHSKVHAPEKNKKELLVTKILYALQENDTDLSITRAVIQWANTNVDVELTIALKKELIIVLKPESNQNIKFIDKATLAEDFLSHYDLIIASAHSAVESLTAGTSTMIIGKRGFGGIVNSSNLEDHMTWSFSGRIGGEVGESIPFWILKDEFDYYLGNRTAVKEETLRIATVLQEKHNKAFIFETITVKISRIAETSRNVLRLRTSLKPVFKKNFKIVNHPSQRSFIVFRENNAVIGSITQDEYSFLLRCSGDRTLNEIASEMRKEVASLERCIKSLQDEKILTFYHEQ